MVLDVFSKYGWIVPLKYKKGENVIIIIIIIIIIITTLFKCRMYIALR